MIDSNARLEPSKLEELGTCAAIMHCDSGLPLSKAVYETVKSVALTAQHLKRILEYANIKAYLTLYEKTCGAQEDGSWLRYVSFPTGPAEFSSIMGMLDACETAQEKPMEDLKDYASIPQDYKAVKVAQDYPEMQKAASLTGPKVKLATLYTDLGTAIQKVEYDVLKFTNLEEETKEAFLRDAKQAVIYDHTLGDIRKVASSSPDQDLDTTLNELAHRMQSVFWDEDKISESFAKTSHLKPIADHPLAIKFATWKEAKNRLNIARGTREVLGEKRAQVWDAMQEKKND